MTANRRGDILISSLRDACCYPHPAGDMQLLETHISWVLLVGNYAYKIKKPLDLGFLDFRELSARKFYCEEEIRLNRRLAPQIYLQAVAIGGSARQPRIGMEPAIEYAVKMRRFPIAMQLDNLLANGGLGARHIEQLAVSLAAFHASLPAAPADSGYGTLMAIVAPSQQNFQQLADLAPCGDAPLLAESQSANQSLYTSCIGLFEQRRRAGFIRECHGDLHLGNIVLLDGAPVAFDCLEFDPKLRWIDVINDIAFLMMDLQRHDRHDLAFRFLDAYLQIGGDYGGLGLLRFYLAYRALVRAKISLMRDPAAGSDAALAEYRGYLRLAGGYLARPRPALIVTHGLPGCGKTFISGMLLEQMRAVRLRSDIERKRLAGLAGDDGSGGLYEDAYSQRTYAHLLRLAEQLLGFGFPVIVDAAFLKQAHRRRFRDLAAKMQTPFVILSIQAGADLLRQRVEQRLRQGNDASDADAGVVDKLLAEHEPLQPDEFAAVIEYPNDAPISESNANFIDLRARIRAVCGELGD